MASVDILIVADQSDLNVHKTASQGSTGIGCCGSTGQGKPSCSGNNDAVKMDGKLDKVDLNEWAGENSPFAEYAARVKLIFVQAHSRYTPSSQSVEGNTADEHKSPSPLDWVSAQVKFQHDNCHPYRSRGYQVLRNAPGQWDPQSQNSWLIES